MKVKIKLSPVFQRFTDNQETLTVQGSTIGECLDDLCRQFPEIKTRLFTTNGTLFALIGVNGKLVFQPDLNQPVSDKDYLQIFPMIAGG